MNETHFEFILAAFTVAAVILSALSLWIAIDYRIVTHALSALEKGGAKRRGKTDNS